MTTVFTNGCFDILHAGHLKLLRYAKSLGDLLVVAVNSDDSVRRIKGKGRPINNLRARIDLLRELRCIDAVLQFEEDTPEGLIRFLRPDILVKGPEAAKAIIPGAAFVESIGGKVVVPDWQVGISTTSILERLQNE